MFSFRMVNLYQKLHRNMQALEWFILRQWVWTHGNMDMLKASMTTEDCRVGYIAICKEHILFSFISTRALFYILVLSQYKAEFAPEISILSAQV